MGNCITDLHNLRGVVVHCITWRRPLHAGSGKRLEWARSPNIHKGPTVQYQRTRVFELFEALSCYFFKSIERREMDGSWIPITLDIRSR